MSNILLAIESSCDDSSAAVLIDDHVVSNITATQTVHKKYGGVIPELASRKHLQHIIPVVSEALAAANISRNQLSAIAVTRGPGLLGSLVVGVNFAKALALSLDIPLIEVNHMEAHILAHFAEEPYPAFPFLCLTVSGGHTQIVRIDAPLSMTVLGQTIDDAAGEAYDKTGKILGLPYPAGPEIDKRAQQGKHTIAFAEPKVDGLDFSFSGLKTSILYTLRKKVAENPEYVKENINDICASVQSTIVSILMKKIIQASKETGIKEIAIAGGVSANSGLRTAIDSEGKKRGWNTYIPAFQYCTDNAGMIAVAAKFKYMAGIYSNQDMIPDPRMKV